MEAHLLHRRASIPTMMQIVVIMSPGISNKQPMKDQQHICLVIVLTPNINTILGLKRGCKIIKRSILKHYINKIYHFNNVLNKPSVKVIQMQESRNTNNIKT